MVVGDNHFARAKHLAECMRGVRIAHGKRSATYVHLMFDTHQIIFAENAASESFYPGPMSLRIMRPEARSEFFSLFPYLEVNPFCRAHIAKTYGETARAILKPRDLADVLFEQTDSNAGMMFLNPNGPSNEAPQTPCQPR